VRTLGSGGTERQAATLALSLKQRGYRVHVGCGEDGGFRAAELREAGIPIFVNPVQGLYKPQAVAAAWRLAAYVRRHRIGLVHTFDFPMNIFAAPVARLVPRVAVLTSQRCFRDTIPPKYHRMLCWAHGRAHAVVTNSREVARHLTQDYGVPVEKIEVCYNGLDLNTFHNRDRVPGNPVVIGAVSVLRPEKGLEDLLRAFAQLPIGVSLRLVIVGDGPEYAALAALAQTLGLGSRCEFHPATKDVASWLRRIDIFVLPSHSEALSNALMEAMACGCAVAATEVGGNPELVASGETGWLFPPRNPAALAACLARLIAQPELRHKIAGAAAAKIATEFSLGQATEQMMRIYQSFGIPAPEGGR
jgi:glycosyltransferase involved in cell wall biosynthesis